ncbi:hypothetical protein NDU88_009810 [Pleurodeles waltl]|uniref:Uncharacterized protein n=1 Tax=Pleurodeles waltl TaxID=8319 RepID=A0AAV7Q026_PLEWA|nr:hypothetical protein NDU88_009810 [Pleurodeles waltl]
MGRPPDSTPLEASAVLPQCYIPQLPVMTSSCTGIRLTLDEAEDGLLHLDGKVGDKVLRKCGGPSGCWFWGANVPGSVAEEIDLDLPVLQRCGPVRSPVVRMRQPATVHGCSLDGFQRISPLWVPSVLRGALSPGEVSRAAGARGGHVPFVRYVLRRLTSSG